MTMQQNAMKSDKMATMAIPKLLFNMSIPAMISMFVQSLYNVVDSIFVANYSIKALDAVTIAFPLQMLIIAFATGIGVGTNAVVAKKLGEKNHKEAQKSAQTGLFISFICAFLFILLGIFISHPFAKSFATDAETITMGSQYLFIILTFSSFAFVGILMSKVFQATGNMKIPMIAQLAGAITNIILDPLFIFGLGFFPSLGIIGAAIATVIGQFVSMCICLFVFLYTKQDVKPFFNKSFRFDKKITGSILRIGIPTIILKGLTSITITFVNIILKAYAYAITVLGIYIKLQSFVLMPVFGLTQGALPILSYNYGANNKARFKNTLTLAIAVSFVIMLTGFIIFQVIPQHLLSLFNSPDALMDMGIIALRLTSISFIFAAFGIMLTVMFQSLGKGFTALLMSLMRQMILLLPLALLFSYFMGINGIWLSYSVAEAMNVFIFFPYAIISIKKSFKNKERLLNETS